jgi:polyketide biosynthesis enoyl-CoA hydratase PksH
MELDGTTIVRVPLLLDATTVHSLHATLRYAIEGNARTVVLTGSGKDFCRGLDLAALQSNAEAIEKAVEVFAACLERIRLSPKPVVAFVEGKAIGGGVGLAAASDGVLATMNSTFELTELLFGLAPAVILPYLAFRIGLQKTRWMAMTAEPLTAERALKIGLVDICCDSLRASTSLKSLTRRLNRLDPDALKSWKQMTRQVPDAGLHEGIVWTAARLQDSKVREGIVKFIETGIPPWIRSKNEERNDDLPD